MTPLSAVTAMLLCFICGGLMGAFLVAILVAAGRADEDAGVK